MAPWCSGYHYCIMQVLRRFKSSRGVSGIRDGEDLWQWSRLEIRLNTVCRLKISVIKKIINTNEVLVRHWKPLAWIRLRIPILLTTQHKYIMKMYSNLLQKNFKNKDILYIVKISNKSNNNANNITKISNTSYPLMFLWHDENLRHNYINC